MAKKIVSSVLAVIILCFALIASITAVISALEWDVVHLRLVFSIFEDNFLNTWANMFSDHYHYQYIDSYHGYDYFVQHIDAEVCGVFNFVYPPLTVFVNHIFYNLKVLATIMLPILLLVVVALLLVFAFVPNKIKEEKVAKKVEKKKARLEKQLAKIELEKTAIIDLSKKAEKN